MYKTQIILDNLFGMWYNLVEVMSMYDIAYEQKFGSMPICTNRFIFDFDNNIFPEYIRRRQKRLQNALPFTMHNHELPEFIYVFGGELDARINGSQRRLAAGDLLAINPWEIHSGHFVPGCRRLDYRYLIFSPTIFSGCRNVTDEFAKIRQGSRRFRQVTDHEKTAKLGIMMEEIGALMKSGGVDGDLAVGEKLFGFVRLLLSEGTEESRASEQRSVDFVRNVGQYVEANLGYELTTATISDALGYNRNYFCSLFKQNFGVSFSSYICEYRIKRAVEKFKGMGTPLSVIAGDVGFTDYCYFSRCFSRIMGVSPSKFFGESN